MAEEKKVKLVIRSDLKDVYLIDMLIESLCSIVHLPDDKAFWIKLSTVEAVNNAIIHAYQKETDHEVEVIFSLTPYQIRIKVCDTGIPLPRHIVEGSMASGEAEKAPEVVGIPESGRGITLIREIMDSVKCIRVEEKNCLVMTKNLI